MKTFATIVALVLLVPYARTPWRYPAFETTHYFD
jgi:hypothetical protein